MSFFIGPFILHERTTFLEGVQDLAKMRQARHNRLTNRGNDPARKEIEELLGKTRPHFQGNMPWKTNSF
jgi:hypothetical protein